MVKYLATNFYLPFITVFLNKFPDNNPKGFLIDDSGDIDHDLDMELEFLTMMNAPLTMDMRPDSLRSIRIMIQNKKSKAELY